MPLAAAPSREQSIQASRGTRVSSPASAACFRVDRSPASASVSPPVEWERSSAHLKHSGEGPAWRTW